MQLREINKSRYKKHLKIVLVSIIVALLILAPAISALIINLFSNPESSHIFHNLSGVVIAACIVAFVLNKFRQHPYMVEVVYVWELKQQLNRIHRKQRKLDAAIENNDEEAMVIMNYMLHGSKQLYELDDNVITMGDLMVKIQMLDTRMEAAGLSLHTDSYKPAMLGRF